MTVGDGESAGYRRLLKLLRDLMKGVGAPQQRLDRIVELIAQDMVTEVCSIYLRRPGDQLELCATKGLRAESVHKTRLSMGEGLVGQIARQARPFALADAQRHPHFAYRPETGEEIYHSLLGVPLMRGGQLLGVLVVQNRTRRAYTDEEVETLETVAMVLSELVAGGQLLGDDEATRAAAVPTRLKGVPLNAGLAMGRVVLHGRGIVISQIVSEDPHAEWRRLEEALQAMRGSIDRMLDHSEIPTLGEHRDVLETYRMFTEDEGWIARIREAIRGGLTAEAAVQKTLDDTRARMGQVRDPYIRERLIDLEDLGNRLLHHVLGLVGEAARALPEDVIVVARDLGPAELLDYDQSRLRGVVLEEGGPHSHAAIVGRALDVPMLGRCAGILSQSHEGDEVIVDADNEQVILRPAQAIRDHFAQSMAARERRKAEFAAMRDLPPVTRDGERVSLMINAGLLIDLPHLNDSGADGIGLYRTEVPFMVRETFPDVDAQTTLYRKVLDQAGERPVAFRTLDVGGDKMLPYMPGKPEANPSLGWRAIRMGLDRPDILCQQFRAMLRAAAGRELRVMFPMVTEIAEFDEAHGLLQRELEEARNSGDGAPEGVRVGVMIEVPSITLEFESLLRRVDFVSVGGNDLFQFLFAVDRGNPRLARRYDVLSPVFLRLCRRLAIQARSAGVPLAFCGEIAGQPLEAMALIGCGIETLSMAPGRLGAVKTMLRSLNVAELRVFLAPLLALPDHSLRNHLTRFAAEQDVII